MAETGRWPAYVQTGLRFQPRPGLTLSHHVRFPAAACDGETVCTFERKVLVYARGHGPYEAAGY